MIKKLNSLLALCACVAAVALTPQARAATNVITTPYLTGSNLWTSNNVYVLTNFVYVMSNATLTIEAGTIVRGRDGAYPNYGALFVNRGGKIFAEGTCDKPIIFTAESDDVADPFDLPIVGSGSRGLWGGVVINGNAQINASVRLALSPIQDAYEGLPDTFGPGGEPLHRFGGGNDNDSSGVLRYVSIRHGGKLIESAKEINGLTMGGVGAGTVIEHVETYLIADDGYEFFGGNVNTKWLVSAFNDDDSFDTDAGYRGKNQFWFTIQAGDKRDEGGELNGVYNELDSSGVFPFASTFQIYNWTAIGAGLGGTNSGNEALVIRQGSQAKIYNSIFTQFDGRKVVYGTNAAADVRHNIFFACTQGNGSGFGSAGVPAVLNVDTNPLLRNITRTNENTLDPRLLPGSPAYTGTTNPPADGFYTQAAHKGAFDCDYWIRGWTALEQNLFLGTYLNQPTVTNVITSPYLTGSNHWTADTVYVLTNFVYVMTNATLTIDPGTVIRGRDGGYPNYGALFVNRGGKLFASGTQCNPIVFTAESDNLNDPFDLPIVGSGSRGLWGGVVINGNAQINASVRLALSPIQDAYEGLPDTFGPGGEPLHRFGGGNDDDSSGILRHISIRHGGKLIESAKEINGLTMGGVGRGTTIECIETYLIADDGYEFFGGNVNTKWLVSAFNDDDSFDTDAGYRGKNQFWFTIQAGDKRDEGGELNGVYNELDSSGVFPFASTFQIYNWTAIGAGLGGTNSGNEALVIRQGSQVKIRNSIFTQFDGRKVVFGTNAAPDVRNNIFFACTQGNGSGYGTAGVPASENPDVDPLLANISRTNFNGLDPRLATGSPAFTNLSTTPADGFYVPASYKGAFDSQNNWTLDWTALDQNLFSRWVCPPVKQLPPTQPNILPATDGAALTFGTAAGYRYQLIANTNLQAGAGWTNEGAAFAGTGNGLTVTNTSGLNQKFYRLLISLP